MIDVNHPIRKAYFELLDGAITYQGNPVPVGDEAKPFADTTPVYIILSSQTDVDNSTLSTWDSNHDIVLDIVFKATSRASKSVVDDIANQIFALVFPAPGQNGLPVQTGIQIQCAKKSGDRDLSLELNKSNTVLRRLITISHKIHQTNDITFNPVPGSLDRIFPVSSPDFDNATDYVNTDLPNRFELFDNDASVYLDYGIQWVYLSGGGFVILIPGFDATIQTHNFYVLLK